MFNWNDVEFNEIFEIGSGKSCKYNKNLSSNFMVYGSNGIIGSHNKHNFNDGFLIGRVGAVGSVHKIKRQIWASDNTLTIKIKNAKICDRDFVHFLLEKLDLKKYSTKTAQPLLTQKNLKRIQIKLPHLLEQQKIAVILSTVDEAIEKTEAIIEQTEKVKKGLMQQLLTKGIGHTKFKKTEIGEIPEEWEVRTLDSVTIKKGGIKRGPFGGAIKKEFFVKEGYAVYEQQHVIYNNFNNIRYFISNAKYDELKSFNVRPGDLLISCSGTVGKIALVPSTVKKGIINQALLRLRLEEEICNKEYFTHLLLSEYMQRKITDMSHGSTLKNIVGMKIFRNVKFPLPIVREQDKINKILTSIDNKISIEKQKHIKLHTLKKGLMQVLLTGKVRVKVDETEEVRS